MFSVHDQNQFIWYYTNKYSILTSSVKVLHTEDVVLSQIICFEFIF